jgi:hypothetical protein
MKIEVGQKVIVQALQRRVGWKYRYQTVERVGSKYFWVSGLYCDAKFSLDDLSQVSDSSATYRIHLSESQLYNELAAAAAYDVLKRALMGYGYNPNSTPFTDDQLRAACSALGLTEAVKEAFVPQYNQLQEALEQWTRE